MEAKVCDECEKMKADFICAICNKDICKRCKRSPSVKIESNPINRYQGINIYRMCTFNFCLTCNGKIPWNGKEPMEDEHTHAMIIEQLKKRILAEEIVKSSGGTDD